jgi:subfamily B ATP-binding cassette protein HlyB/CyaB
VHRTLSTLDVLIIGLVAIAIFETILGILRTYLFAHTTNRIDVELGARLFRHLVALPIAYFQARTVGDSVARVRELENIRNFLTSSALTLVIDLFFTVVFLAVMFVYSPLLTWIVLGAFPFYYLWVLGGGIIIVDDGMDHLSHRRRCVGLAACRSCGSSAVCCGRRRGYP